MRTDICIVGGGLVGLAAALTFSHQGRKVKLLESMDLKPETPAQLDARSLALSHASVQILSSLGLWQSLQPSTAAIRRIHVSSAGHFGVTRMDAGDLNVEAMGYVVEYHVLMQHLLEAVKTDRNVELISPARFLSLQQLADSVTLDYQVGDNEQSLTASVLVVADGANSSVRQYLGIGTEITDFRQNAIVANVSTQQSGQAVAYERFTPSGPLAMLPLPGGRYALVWTNEPQRSQQLMECTDAGFLQRLYATFGYRLGYFDDVGTRAQFPLKLTRSSQLVSGRCVLIGNAANTLHPVAGQGLNLALRDIAALYDSLNGIDLSSDSAIARLDAFQGQRKPDQNQAVGISSSLVHLFSNDLPLLNHARAGALMALDLCPPLKREFSWYGMGYGTGASSLMRGAI